MRYAIHAGLTKTGSTSIQRFLSSNTDLLRDQGILFDPFCLGQRGQHSALVPALRGDHREKVAQFVQGLHDQAVDAGASRIIITGELLALMPPPSIRLFRDIINNVGRPTADAQVVIYVRNLYDRLLSRLNQQLRTRDQLIDVRYVADRVNRPNLSDQLLVWESCFGEAAVDVRLFERARATGLERDFMTTLGGEWDSRFVLPPPMHRSIDHITAQVLNLLRVEVRDLPGLRSEVERFSTSLHLPRIESELILALDAAVAAADLSHPKLAAHEAILRHRPQPDTRESPRLAEVLDTLIATLQLIRDRATAEDQLGPREVHSPDVMGANSPSSPSG